MAAKMTNASMTELAKAILLRSNRGRNWLCSVAGFGLCRGVVAIQCLAILSPVCGPQVR
jgi:hypothetical protein